MNVPQKSFLTFKTNECSRSGISNAVVTLTSDMRKQNKPVFGFIDWKNKENHVEDRSETFHPKHFYLE